MIHTRKECITQFFFFSFSLNTEKRNSSGEHHWQHWTGRGKTRSNFSWKRTDEMTFSLLLVQTWKPIPLWGSCSLFFFSFISHVILCSVSPVHAFYIITTVPGSSQEWTRETDCTKGDNCFFPFCTFIPFSISSKNRENKREITSHRIPWKRRHRKRKCLLRSCISVEFNLKRHKKRGIKEINRKLLISKKDTTCILAILTITWAEYSTLKTFNHFFTDGAKDRMRYTEVVIQGNRIWSAIHLHWSPLTVGLLFWRRKTSKENTIDSLDHSTFSHPLYTLLWLSRRF
jgi:hypothetical protein